MILRLWWKEGRTLAPIAATVAVAALALQSFLDAYGGAQVYNGLFIALGLGWATLYALVAATASFAGERETRMLGFLDALPVDRSTLWVGKATFVLTSSLVLAFALASMGQFGSRRIVDLPATVGIDGDSLCLILVESVAWGLLWSSLCRTAIAAGIGAVVSVGVVTSMAPLGLTDHPLLAWALSIRLLLLVAAAGLSWLILTREGLPRPASGPITLRLRVRPEPLPTLGTVGPGRAARPRRTIRPTPAFPRLAWQTVQEGRGTWLLALGLGVGTVVPGLLLFRDDGNNAAVIMGLLAMAILVQGVSAFGLENASGTRSFLDHQAIPPGTIWAAKVVPWLGALLAFALAVGASVFLSESLGRGRGLPAGPAGSAELLALFILTCMILHIFGVGLIAGMMFRRRITAALVGLLALVVVAIPQIVVLSSLMAPAWTALAGPLILLGISRCWAGDWVGDRGAVRRWARLAGLVAAPTVLVALLYVGGRAYEIPDIGPQGFGPVATAAPSPVAQDARDLARRIGPMLLNSDDQDRLARRGWAGATPAAQHLWSQKGSLVPEVRALALDPSPIDFGPHQPDYERDGTGPGWTQGILAQLLLVDAVERRSRGDFAGAWDDILAQVRLGDRFAAGAWSPSEWGTALKGVESAVRQGVAWASDPKVPLAAIEAARASLREVQTIPSAEGALRHEADLAERRLDRPTEDWVNENNPGAELPDLMRAVDRIYTAWVVAPSWERERTRRIVRRAVAATLVDLRSDRAARLTMPWSWSPVQGGSTLRTPLVDRVMGPLLLGPSDRDQSQAVRRMLDLFLALRAWQLTHDGRSPDELAQLFDGDRSRVPNDPLSYQRRPFGYRLQGDEDGPTRILYSVGPDSQDHEGRRPGREVGFEAQPFGAFEDIVFALPPEPALPKPPVPPTAAPGPPTDDGAPPPASPRP